jgi:hypothetical protein
VYRSCVGTCWVDRRATGSLEWDVFFFEFLEAVRRVDFFEPFLADLEDDADSDFAAVALFAVFA